MFPRYASDNGHTTFTTTKPDKITHVLSCWSRRCTNSSAMWGSLAQSPQFGVGRRGSPRIVPICSDFPVFFRFVLICAPCFREYPDLLQFVRAAKPAEVCLWNFWWNLIWNSIWNLKFPMGKILWNLGEDFSTCQESMKSFGVRVNFGANFGANFGEIFGNFVSNFATFFRNFVQQKGGANNLLRFLPICSDCFRNKSEQIRETPFCRPLLEVPDWYETSCTT